MTSTAAIQTRRMAAGEDLFATVEKMDLPHGTWLQASGYVEAVQVEQTHPEGDEILAISGQLHLLSLNGPVEGPLMVILARGAEVIGGKSSVDDGAGVGGGVEARDPVINLAWMRDRAREIGTFWVPEHRADH